MQINNAVLLCRLTSKFITKSSKKARQKEKYAFCIFNCSNKELIQVSKEKCLFQHVAVLLLAVLKIVLHPLRQQTLRCTFHPVTKKEKLRKNKNNKSFILIKSKSRTVCSIILTTNQIMHRLYTSMVLWLFPYRVNVEKVTLNPICIVFVDKFREFTIN